MKRVGALNTYRMIMIFIHLFFTNWILNIFGFTLKTFLYLTKINFFMNFFYFFYSGVIVSYIKYKVAENKKNPNHFYNPERLSHQEKFMNSIFKFSFCLSVVVNILYWSLVFFKPNMLGTTEIPKLLDLFLHGGNLVVLLIDFIFNHKFNREHQWITKTFLVHFTISYASMQYFVFYTLEIEVYPMISKLSLPQYSVVGAAAFGLFLIGEFFYDKILPFSNNKNLHFKFNEPEIKKMD